MLFDRRGRLRTCFFWVDITSIWIWNFNILDAGKSFSAVSNEARGRFHRGVGGSKALTKLVIQLLFSESNRKPEKFWRKRFLRLHYLALQNVLQFPLPRPWVNVVMSIFFGKKHPKCLELWCVCCFDTWGYGTKSTDFVEKKWHDFIEIPSPFNPAENAGFGFARHEPKSWHLVIFRFYFCCTHSNPHKIEKGTCTWTFQRVPNGS